MDHCLSLFFNVINPAYLKVFLIVHSYQGFLWIVGQEQLFLLLNEFRIQAVQNTHCSSLR